MVGHKIGVLTEPITRTRDPNDDGVVKQPIEECGSSPKTLPHSAKPRFEVSIMASFSYRALTSWKNRLPPPATTGDFVDDKQRESAKEPDLVARGASALGLGEAGSQCGGGDAIEIAADAHHAFIGEASFELQHRTIGDKG